MNSGEDILELKFEGNEISPSKVKPGEIAALIASFDRALSLTIKQKYPEIDIDTILFSFEEIDNKSLDLRFKARQVFDVVTASFFALTTHVSTGDYGNLNSSIIQSLRVISKFAKKYDCVAYFKYNNETLTTLNKDTEINIKADFSAKGQTTIYGKVIDVGGERPNVHLKMGDERIIIETTEKIAKELGKRLFETVGLKGEAEWNIITSEIISFKIDAILPYKEGNTFNAFSELKTLSSGYWDNYNTDEEIYTELLRD